MRRTHAGLLTAHAPKLTLKNVGCITRRLTRHRHSVIFRGRHLFSQYLLLRFCLLFSHEALELTRRHTFLGSPSCDFITSLLCSKRLNTPSTIRLCCSGCSHTLRLLPHEVFHFCCKAAFELTLAGLGKLALVLRTGFRLFFFMHRRRLPGAFARKRCHDRLLRLYDLLKTLLGLNVAWVFVRMPAKRQPPVGALNFRCSIAFFKVKERVRLTKAEVLPTEGGRSLPGRWRIG